MMLLSAIVIYPRPTDIDAFEKLYQEEHVPMAVEKLAGKTKIVATKVIHSLEGSAPYFRIAEIHFPSMKALKACASSELIEQGCKIYGTDLMRPR
jgi:uncharacterized protein (TIGR02118 family)